MLEFGALLRLYRIQAGITQTEMAELVCHSQPVYSRIEAGLRSLSVNALQRVADYADVPLQKLIFAFLVLDENLEVIAPFANDPVSKSLLALAQKYREQVPTRLKNAAALGILFDDPRP